MDVTSKFELQNAWPDPLTVLQINWKDLNVQKQIGEGSFGKVYLAKWRETTVAAKVLLGGTTNSTDEEFPNRDSPLLDGLTKVFPAMTLHGVPAAPRVCLAVCNKRILCFLFITVIEFHSRQEKESHKKRKLCAIYLMMCRNEIHAVSPLMADCLEEPRMSVQEASGTGTLFCGCICVQFGNFLTVLNYWSQ